MEIVCLQGESSMKKTKDTSLPFKKSVKHIRFIILYVAIVVVFILLACSAWKLFSSYPAIQSYEDHVLQIANLNKDTVFSLNNVFIFSSASATTNTESQSLWSLDVHQYSDIALFINNHPSNGYTTKNTISKLYIDNFQINGTNAGTPSLSYKDVQTFGKFVDLEETAISDTLTYTITNGTTIDSTIAQMDISCKTPITLGLIQKNVKQEYTVVDTSTALQYNGSLLKTATIPLGSITPTISFDIHIENQLQEQYICNVQFTLPLENETQSIYDGTFRQDIVYEKPFFRVS